MEPEKQQPKPGDDRQDFHPDQPISPRQAQPAAPAAPVDSAAQPPAPEQQPADAPEPSFFTADDSSAGAAAATADQASAQPAPAPTEPAAAADDSKSVTWTASEFIEHEKSPLWYLALAGGGLVLAGLVYLITREIFMTVVAVMVVAIFGFAASRPPREKQYIIDGHGISIGSRHFLYSDFRSFSILEEGPLKSINLLPMKRFMPPMSIYFDPADEDHIAEVLSAHLPFEPHRHDPLDGLMRKIRF